MRRPNLFIVGAPKSGTTAMQHYLREHPEIFMITGPEPHYFGSDIRLSWIPDLTEDTYLQLFSAQNGETLIGEKSTSYLTSGLAAAEIKAFSPNAYNIVMLRNPVDMVYALHSQLLFMGVETIPDFNEALTTEAERTAPLRSDLSDGPNLNGRFYWDAVCYAEQLQRFFDEFGRDRVHVIIYDDFKRDTAKVYEETLRYLEIGADFRPDFVVINANKRHRLELIHRPPEIALRLARALLPKPIRRILRARIESLNTVQASRRPIEPELRKRLQVELEPEVQRLSKLLDRDLTAWLT